MIGSWSQVRLHGWTEYVVEEHDLSAWFGCMVRVHGWSTW